MIASNRAFVFLKNIEHQSIGEKTTHTITGWNFIAQWENGGNTPAKNRTTMSIAVSSNCQSNLISSFRT